MWRHLSLVMLVQVALAATGGKAVPPDSWHRSHTAPLTIQNLLSNYTFIFPMLKNCSACKSKHTPPFGRYCKFVSGAYCVFCDKHHDPPVGLLCPTYLDSTLGETAPTLATTPPPAPAVSSASPVTGQPTWTPTTAPPGSPAVSGAGSVKKPHVASGDTTDTDTTVISTTKMAERSKPVSEGFVNRDDPGYLAFLEEQFELGQRRADSQTDEILRRLESLEKQRTTWHSPTETLSRSVGQSAVQRPAAVGGAVGGSAVGGTGLGASTTSSPGEAIPPGGRQEAEVDPSLLPLTDALAQLTLAVDPAAGKSKGLLVRPEYYVQHVKAGTALKQIDHNKLSYKELVYGWFCVLHHLHANGGDVLGYMGHCKFASEQAMSDNFIDSAFVKYDRHVVSKVVDGLSNTFTVGDNLGVASCMNAASLVPPKPTAQKRSGRFKPKRNPSDSKDKSDSSYMPEGFPEDVCYSFNYRSCTGKCSKKHSCRNCKGDHPAKSCQAKKD